jgi:hypothetical protein
MPRYLLEYDHELINFGSAAHGSFALASLPDPYVEYTEEEGEFVARTNREALEFVEKFAEIPTGQIFERGTKKERIMMNRPRSLKKIIKGWPGRYGTKKYPKLSLKSPK